MGQLLAGNIYVYQIWRRIGGSFGSIQAALCDLEDRGYVSSRMVVQRGADPRRRYDLTSKAIDARAWEIE